MTKLIKVLQNRRTDHRLYLHSSKILDTTRHRPRHSMATFEAQRSQLPQKLRVEPNQLSTLYVFPSQTWSFPTCKHLFSSQNRLNSFAPNSRWPNRARHINRSYLKNDHAAMMVNSNSRFMMICMGSRMSPYECRTESMNL